MWLNDYSNRIKLTIPASEITSPQTDFPVCVKLNSTNFNFSQAQADGEDIRFMGKDGITLLKFIQISYDSGTELAEFHVELPSVSDVADTIFYCYYGNPTAPNAFAIDITSGITPSADSEYSSYWGAHKANNDTWGMAGTTWSTIAGALPHWWKIDLGSGNEKIVHTYTIRARDVDVQNSIKTWKFQGSNNDSDWVDLDIIPSETGWVANELRTYDSFSEGVNNTAYRYYRLYITANNGTGYTQITELEFIAGELNPNAIITPDEGLLLGYGQEEDQSASYELSPEFQWRVKGTKQKDVAFQWQVGQKNQQNPQFQWSVKGDHKFYPNIVSYPFYWELPVIQESKVSANVSGCCLGYSVHLKKTGTSGNTTLEIYLNDVLKSTLNIPANDSEYNKNILFDLTDLLHPEDLLKVKVISVGNGSEDLKVTAYEMTFDYSLKEMDYQNISNNIIFTGKNRKTLFESADAWSIEFNQPISQIVSIEGIDNNNDSIALTAVIEDGTFSKNRLNITPHANTSIETIKIKLRDLKETEHLFELSPTIKTAYSDYEKYYRSASSEIESFLPIYGYRYSFDAGDSWSDWGSPSNQNKLIVNFAGKSQASYPMKFQYRNGDYTIEESKSIYYAPNEIETDVFFKGTLAEIEYTDMIPLDKIQVYYDEVLSDEFTIPAVSGMENITTDSTNKQIIISSGSIYYNNKKYDFDGLAYDLQIDLNQSPIKLLWRVIFGFNKSTLTFEYKKFHRNYGEGLSKNLYANFICLWAVDYSINFLSASSFEYSISFFDRAFIFKENQITINLDNTHDILIKIVDVAGRTKNFIQKYVTQFYNLWRTLSVKDDSSNEIDSGQIHQNTTLNYTITTDDWS